MSNSFDGSKLIPALAGKTVTVASYGVINGYGFVYLEFADGSEMKVEEIGQAGEIALRLDENPPVYPQDEGYE